MTGNDGNRRRMCKKVYNTPSKKSKPLKFSLLKLVKNQKTPSLYQLFDEYSLNIF